MSSRVQRLVEMMLVAVAALVSWVCDAATASTVLEIQKALIGFAGLVVTIFGIWIAVIFPVLSGLLANGKARREVSQLARYDILVQALYRSCFSLTACFLVFLILSFCTGYSVLVAKFAAFFSWLAFISTAWSLWSAILGGEGAVVGGINDSIRSGLIRRVRFLGRRVKRKDASNS